MESEGKPQMETGQSPEYTDESPVVSLTVGEFKDVIAQATQPAEETEAELAGKRDGGEAILRPGQPHLQEKVIPIDDFFHKIVMLRDRLRVLEQKLNSHSKLTAGEKVELQQYITRSYGSLTTFNVLFQHRDEGFRGTGRAL